MTVMRETLNAWRNAYIILQFTTSPSLAYGLCKASYLQTYILQ